MSDLTHKVERLHYWEVMNLRNEIKGILADYANLNERKQLKAIIEAFAKYKIRPE